MYFQSLEFAIFLPVVFVAYWFVFKNSLSLQNVSLLIASYVFYGWWDYRFLALIFISSLIDYVVALRLKSENKYSKRKILLMISLILNLGMLGFFKYCNFFIESFAESIRFFGFSPSIDTLEIVLPVGISFYTFQTLSYTIDVYRRQLEPSKNLLGFLTFVSFFPQLVAGPIERASNLLPQFYSRKNFNYDNAVDGSRQILWGLFKKVVIADNCAEIANHIFANYETLPGSMLLLGAFFFAFQIYGDFSGYSDMAIGIARLFGFKLMKNFNFPYFSRDIAEFWRRWHISLSTWFRDYVYIPLGGSKVSLIKQIRNTLVIFIVSGFWHGANWTFVFWGLLNALYFIPLLVANSNRKNLNTVAEGKIVPHFMDIVKIAVTFLMVILAWIFFRAENLSHAFMYYKGIFNSSLFTLPELRLPELIAFLLVIGFIVVEWFNRNSNYAIEKIHLKMPAWCAWTVYIFILMIAAIYAGSPVEFIYFQF